LFISAPYLKLLLLFHCMSYANNLNRTSLYRKGLTSGAGTTNPSWVHSRFSVGFLLLLFCIVFCRSLFVLFSFRNCIVCPSIYDFWLHFWFKHRLPKSQTLSATVQRHLYEYTVTNIRLYFKSEYKTYYPNINCEYYVGQSRV
jgi:hypothetical protein